MKLFYFGSVCSQAVFDQTVRESKRPPSASAQNFETALIKGFSGCKGIELTIASAESIAMYPGSRRVILRKRRDELVGGVFTEIVPAINLPFIKQWCHANGTAKQLRAWLKQNRDDPDKCVLSYGIYPAVAKKLQRLCQRYNCKCVCLITDVPKTMFTYTDSGSALKKLFGKAYRENAVRLQSLFDGYVFLTEQMSEAVAPGKPYVVVETIADTKIFDGLESVKKANPPVLMYAGSLFKNFGIDLIVDAFRQVDADCELWLFGSGDHEEEIRKAALADPRIKLFGRVDRGTVLRAEREATLLLNLRNGEDEYTQYSFPSKMVEYLLSGTPVLTTKLAGIPDEYYGYCYAATSRDPKEIAQQIETILTDEKREQLGERAKQFVLEQKNCYVQAETIAAFLTEETGRGR